MLRINMKFVKRLWPKRISSPKIPILNANEGWCVIFVLFFVTNCEIKLVRQKIISTEWTPQQKSKTKPSSTVKHILWMKHDDTHNVRTHSTLPPLGSRSLFFSHSFTLVLFEAIKWIDCFVLLITFTRFTCAMKREKEKQSLLNSTTFAYHWLFIWLLW